MLALYTSQAGSMRSHVQEFESPGSHERMPALLVLAGTTAERALITQLPCPAHRQLSYPPADDADVELLPYIWRDIVRCYWRPWGRLVIDRESRYEAFNRDFIFRAAAAAAAGNSCVLSTAVAAAAVLLLVAQEA